MSRSTTDTVVEFEIHRNDFGEMMHWMFTIDTNTWWTAKAANGRIIGFSFRHPQDAVAFKLRFGI